MTVRHIRGVDGSIQFVWIDEEPSPVGQYERYMRERVEHLRNTMEVTNLNLMYNPDYGSASLGNLFDGRPVLPTIECARCRKTPDEMSPVGWKQTNRGRMYCVEVKCHGDCEELQIFHTYVAGTQGTPKIPAFGDWL